ncbi:MAG: glycoside hydrolase family 2 [Bacteroidales bacterium]|nr:glycoside hydrolase family 2 [Bacteroidales bacterium]
MYKIISLLAFGGLAAMPLAAGPLELQLTDGWKVQSAAKVDTKGTPIANPSAWYDATVPATVMGVLTENKVYPADILDGMNYKTIDNAQFDQPWWWQTSFTLPKLSKDQHVTLDLDGISYRADIWLNGTQIASADTLAGSFRRHSIDITPYVGTDNNVAFKVYRAKAGEPNIGFVDWNPRPADESMGIFRPVFVRVTDAVDLSKPVVKTKVNKQTLAEAWLTFQTTLTNKSDRPVAGTLRISFDGRNIAKPVTLRAGETRLVTLTAADTPELYVQNPRLWWCNNLGNPDMYRMDVAFDVDGKPSDSAIVNFGIREIEDYFTPDNQRGFRLNGRPVLVRSAGWTDDIFLRNDSTRNEAEVRLVRDMNLNSIRFENVWGTSEDIYDLCDRYGLLALTGWSCQWEWENYLGTPADDFGCIASDADMDLIAASLADQVYWLRNHPSIIGWFVGSDMLPRPALEQRYNDALYGVDERPVITAAAWKESALSGPSGTKMAGPYEYVAPNYWYSPEAPGGAFGWNTETGIGAQLPQRESVIRTVGKDNVWPINDVWNYHCTASSSAMNTMDTLTATINRRLGPATDFNDYVRKAEWLNYDGTRTMFEAFRARIPRATGIVQWMLNSAWPSFYWQLYDHYLVPTSAFYSLHHSNAPVQLIYDYGKEAVFAVNETLDPVSLTATMKTYGLADATPAVATAPVTVQPYTVVKVFDVPRPGELEFVFLTLDDAAGAEVARNFYVLSPDSDVHDWAKNDWTGTPVARHADFTGLAKLKEAKLTTKLQRNPDGVTVTLTNPAKNVAFFNRLAAKDAAGQLIEPARWSDNYISLQPGETRTITCTLPAGTASKAVITLDGWNTPEITL